MTDPAIIDATAVATPAHLTAQNLDPNSRFFVPVELRPFYDKPDLMEPASSTGTPNTRSPSGWSGPGWPPTPTPGAPSSTNWPPAA